MAGERPRRSPVLFCDVANARSAFATSQNKIFAQRSRASIWREKAKPPSIDTLFKEDKKGFNKVTFLKLSRDKYTREGNTCQGDVAALSRVSSQS